MQESFEIKSSAGKYSVSLGENLLSNILDSSVDNQVLIIDKFFSEKLSLNCNKVIEVVAVENSKALENIAEIIDQLRKHGANRNTKVVAIGGGIIQDVATFVSSIYMRGVSWDYFPTTLLGMVDSCIGGKSSINVFQYKNLVGNFHPPRQILIDIDFVISLNQEQVISGLCEAVKICYASGEKDFEAYLKEAPLNSINLAQARNIISRSLKAKKWFIETDEFDIKERLLLNYGHTFGHALESATDFQVPHGIAVGAGMVIADQYSRTQNILEESGRVRSDKLTVYVKNLLEEMRDVRAIIKNVNLDAVMNSFDNDKKHSTHEYRIIVPVGDGGLERISVSRDSSGRKLIRDVFSQVTTNFLY